MEKNINLTTRDRLVLEHLKTFEISTKHVLRTQFFEGKKMAAVVSMQRRLDDRGVGYIYGTQIPGSRTLYFRLTQRGADYLGVKSNTQPMKDTKLFGLIGRLYFFHRVPAGIQRSICTDSMLLKFINNEDLETGKIRPPRVDFYIAQNKIEDDKHSGLALGVILPDLNSTVRRVSDRVLNHSENFIERNWFIDVMKAGRFEWTILTGHRPKVEELQMAVTRKLRRRLAALYFRHSLDLSERPPIQVKVEVIPELANLRMLKKKKKAIRDPSFKVPGPRKNNGRR